MGRKKNASANTWIDPDDAPASPAHGSRRLIRRGRPRSAGPKVGDQPSFRSDVLGRYRATGPGWQSRINQALRKAPDWARAEGA